MIAFTGADHISERQVGKWTECTWASMLETLRLGLPNGRDIPVTMAEVDRFRGAAGFTDQNAGATIEQTLAVAKRLYGLAEGDFTLTRDWNVLASFLEDENVVATVTGRMGNFPSTVHRWDAYTGPHAVAKHDSRVLCDPLAPKGTYIGEEVSLSGWRAFFTGLVGSQAFVMRVAGGEVVAVTDASPKLVDLAANVQLTGTDGKPLVKMSGAAVGLYSPFGSADKRAVVITTGGVTQLGFVALTACKNIRPYSAAAAGAWTVNGKPVSSGSITF